MAFAVRQLAPEKLPLYLRERGKRRGSEIDWIRALEAAGLPVQKVLELAEGPDRQGPVEAILKQMRATADLLKQLDAGGDVILLGENCELIPVKSREELKYYLELIGKRRAPEK